MMSKIYLELAEDSFMSWIENRNEYSLLSAYENVTMAYANAVNNMDSDLMTECYTYQYFLYGMIGQMLMR